MKRLALALPIVALLLPATGRAQNVQQMLQGLMTGNQSQDKALQDAYERGYQRGRQDEANLHRPQGGGYQQRNGYNQQGYPQQGYQQGQQPSDPYRR